MKLCRDSCLILLAGFTAIALSQPALSQNATSSALSADINYRLRELERDPNNAEARAQLAAALDRKGDYKNMIEILEGHKEKAGRAGLILLARAYFKTGRFTDEVAAVELANARYPKDAQLQTFLAEALVHAGRKDAALEAYYKAKETNPKYIPAYEGLLRELIKVESRQEARDLLSDMSKKFGLRAKWASDLCGLYTADAFYDKAVQICSKAMKKDRNNPMNTVNLAQTYRELGEPEKAKKILVSTAGRIRRSEPIQTALGDYFVEKKNFVDAFRWYRAGATSDPKSYRAQLGLAQSALELQKMEDSVKAFGLACKLDRKAIREFQSALGKIRQRSDVKWQSRFEDEIAQSCQPGGI